MTSITRRAAFGAIASIPALGAATAAAPFPATAEAETPSERVTRLAMELSAAMEGMHGGEWRVTVDHAFGFALIVHDRAVQS